MNAFARAPKAAPSVKENLSALRAAQKPARGTAAYSRHVNRPLGRLVAAAAHSAGLSPNQATAISAVFTATGLCLLATVSPTWQLGLAVAMLLAAGYVMDSVDGQLARLRHSQSKSGDWLDHTVDCVKTVTLHIAVLLSWYQHPPVDSDAVLLIPLGFQIVDVVTYFGFIVMTLARPAKPDRAGSAEEHPLRRWLLLPADYGFVLWMFVFLAWQMVFLAAYTALFAINAALLVLAFRKWWRELRTLDGAR